MSTNKAKGFFEEFKTFAMRGNVIDMAVGVDGVLGEDAAAAEQADQHKGGQEQGKNAFFHSKDHLSLYVCG